MSSRAHNTSVVAYSEGNATDFHIDKSSTQAPERARPTNPEQKTFAYSDLTVESESSSPSSDPSSSEVSPSYARTVSVLECSKPQTVEIHDSGSSESNGKDSTISETVESSSADSVAAVGNSTVSANSTIFGDSNGQTVTTSAANANDTDERGRVFIITSHLMHQYTGELLHTTDELDVAAQRKGTERAAWIIHDKDVYSEEDRARNPQVVVGESKPIHFHAVEKRKNQTSSSSVARAWNVPLELVHVAKGRNAFEDCCLYLTHENPKAIASGKHRYSDEKVHTTGFDFRAMANKYKERQGAKEKSFSPQELLFLIQEKGLTPRQAKKQDPVGFLKTGYNRIYAARDEYLKTAPLPPMRTNYYVSGRAGTGKSSLAYIFASAYACQMYPNLDVEDAIYFAGREGVELQQYTGQPIIIWDDFRPWTLIHAFGDRSGFFSAFDNIPNRAEVNKKYGSVRLVNAVNIVTGILPHHEFLNQLAGEYTNTRGESFEAEDKNQSYRRFPFIIELTSDTIDFYLSRGFAEGTPAWESYISIARFEANMGSLTEKILACGTNEEREKVRARIGERLCKDLLAQDRKLRQQSTPDTDDVVSAALTGVRALALPGPAEAEFDGLVRRLSENYREVADLQAVVGELNQFVETDNSGYSSKTTYKMTTRNRDKFFNAKLQLRRVYKEIHRLARQIADTEYFRTLVTPVIDGWLAEGYANYELASNGGAIDVVTEFTPEKEWVRVTGRSTCGNRFNIRGDFSDFDSAHCTYRGVSPRSFNDVGPLSVLGDGLCAVLKLVRRDDVAGTWGAGSD